MNLPEPEQNQPPPQSPSRSDAWSSLSRYTSARIALGRTGGSWRTQTLLDFRLAHAQARDAVCRKFDADALEAKIRQAGWETVRLATAAETHAEFLRRPDLGQRLSESSRHFLMQNAASWRGRDLAVLVSDGLSPLAAMSQVSPTLATLVPPLIRAGWTICPIFVIPFARVKLQDELGALLEARQALMLLGERPGLGSPDSLGAYLTWRPGLDKTDADRNCVSNIRPQGLPPEIAGAKLAQLLMQSAEQRLSGIHLRHSAGRELE